MLFDLSGSIGNNLPLVKAAGTEFVTDLTGTPTSIALFTFSTNSPQNPTNSQNRPALVSIADPAGATQVKGWINGFSKAEGGTNWDAGLRRVADAPQQYDVVVVITDGNPTAWEGEKSSTSTINDYDVENAVHSANWVKSEGTRVVSIGVSGQSGGLSPVNLQTISGTVLNSDYYLTTFGDLDDVLSSIALNGCGGTISVQKRIAPSFDAAQSVPQEPDWPFSVDRAQSYVTPPSGTTGPNGEPLTFKVTFEQNQLARDVTISEPANHKGTVLVQDASKNARCFNKGQPLPANRLENAGGFGFTVKGVVDKDIISCTVVDSDAQLQAVKYNDTNGNGTRQNGEPGLPNWTMFLDDNGNSTLDFGERSASTNAQGEALFDRLEVPKQYRVCEVLQSGWFNTDPGGGAVCKTQQVDLGDAPAGPVLFGNIQAGGFTVTKDVVDTGDFVADDLTFTINVACTFNNQPVTGYPRDVTLADGESARLGPLLNGTTCTVTEASTNGAVVTGVPRAVSIPQDNGVTVTVTNTYPVGNGEVTKTVVLQPDLPASLIPKGTSYPIEVRCTFPNTPGLPQAGQPVPGFNPLRTTIVSGDPGQPGPATPFGPLPVGSQCTVSEPSSNGATAVDIQPAQPVTIPSGTTPVSVTVTNTYAPAAIKIVKEVLPAGIVPDSTQFVAEVQCTFGTQVKNERVTFSVQTPGIVSNIPQGSTCEVTEVETRGGVAAVNPAGTFPVDGPAVEVTITNTFQQGQLTVTKVVDDPSGLVAKGTKYTINVACTFAGNSLRGYPKNVQLTYDTELSETLTGLPYGTTCTLTEPNLNGAGSVEFAPSSPVTISATTPAVTVRATNTYPVGTFPISKAVDGPGAGFVPGNTAFVVTATCTLPSGFPGANPSPIVKTITTTSGAVVGPLPVGTTCGVAETNSQGAGSSTVVPGSVTIVEGATNVEVKVTNTYPVGSFTVTKAVDGLGANLLPTGTEFTVEVRCTFPPGFPAAGPIPGFSPTQVVLKAPGLPADGTAQVGPLPVGSVCTLSEPNLNGASSVTFTPNPVTVPGKGDKPVQAVVTNTYPAGYGKVVKVANGLLAAQLAPEGTTFLVDVRCTFPPAFPASGAIPGYSPLELAIESGPPGQPGIPAQFGPLPVGSSCSVVETQTNGAKPVVVVPSSITIKDALDPDTATVTVTNTFNPAALRINKVVIGPGASLLPTDTVFKAGVKCTFENQTTFDGVVEFSVENPGEVTDQPIGASCAITETVDNGATNVAISPNPAILQGPSPVLVDATVTNTMPAGQLTVQKVIAGGAAGVVPDGVSFTVGVNCSFQGTALPGYPQELTFTTPNRLSETLTGLPVGAQCFVNESDDGGATSVEFVPPAGPNDPAGQSTTVTVTGDTQRPVIVSVRNIFEPALLRILKVVKPEGVLLPPGLRFVAQVDCTFGGESIYSGAVEFGPTSPGVVSGLIVGAECTVAEIESFGASFDPPSRTVTITEAQPDYEVTITNTFQTGSLTVAKAVDDGGTGYVHADTPYDIGVACTFDGAALPGYPTAVTVTPAGGAVGLPGLLPVGTVCELSEPNLNGAASVSFSPGSPVEITADVPNVEVTATNAYPMGTFTVSKAVDGPGGPYVPAGTQFPIEVSCVFPAGFPAAGAVPGFDPLTFTLTGGGSRQVGPLPVGSTCNITEMDAKGAGSSTVTPDMVTVAAGEQAVNVVVTNTYLAGSLEIVKQITGSGAATATGPFEFSVTCTFLGAPLNPQPANVKMSRPTLSATVGGLPAGANCTVSELPPYGGADGLGVIVPSSVVIGSGGPVRVVVTNTFTKPAVPIPGLTKSADPPSGETVFTGDIVTYAITVQNGGDAPVVNETLVDRLPEGADLIESSITPTSGVYDKKANSITWKFSLPAAVGGTPSSATFSYQVEVTSDDGSLVNSVQWVEWNLTGRTEHAVEPGTTGGATDKTPPDEPTTGGLTDTGAGDAVSIASAGLLAMVLGGLMVGFGRRRRREQ